MLGELDKRNGYTSKKVKSEAGTLSIKTPRDRSGEFEPVILEKRQRTLSSGVDDQILALYAQGNSVEDVRRLLERIYGIEMSAGQISQITDKVLPELQLWRDRPLQSFIRWYIWMRSTSKCAMRTGMSHEHFTLCTP